MNSDTNNLKDDKFGGKSLNNLSLWGYALVDYFRFVQEILMKQPPSMKLLIFSFSFSF